MNPQKNLKVIRYLSSYFNIDLIPVFFMENYNPDIHGCFRWNENYIVIYDSGIDDPDTLVEEFTHYYVYLKFNCKEHDDVFKKYYQMIRKVYAKRYTCFYDLHRELKTTKSAGMPAGFA